MVTRFRPQGKNHKLIFAIALVFCTVLGSYMALSLSDSDGPAFRTDARYVWAPFGEGIPGSSRALKN